MHYVFVVRKDSNYALWNWKTLSVEVLNLSCGTFPTKHVDTVSASDKIHSTLLIKDSFRYQIKGIKYDIGSSIIKPNNEIST